MRLPRGNASDLAQVALRQGVGIVPGTVNSPDNSFADHVRLPFVHQPEVLADGIERLARAWREYQPGLTSRRAELGVIL